MKFNLALAKLYPAKTISLISQVLRKMFLYFNEIEQEQLATCVLQRLQLSVKGFLLLATGLPFRGPEWFHCQSLMPIQKYRHILGYKSTGQQGHHLGQAVGGMAIGC